MHDGATDHFVLFCHLLCACADIQNTAHTNVRFLVRASYLQIYSSSFASHITLRDLCFFRREGAAAHHQMLDSLCFISFSFFPDEVISDLLKPERTNLSIREDKKKGVFVEGLSEWVVRSPKEVYGLIRRGTALRATGATRINETSSRSHAIFIIIVEQNELIYEDDPATGAATTTAGKQRATAANNAAGMTEQEKARAVAGAGNATLVRQSFKVGKLNLVDCA